MVEVSAGFRRRRPEGIAVTLVPHGLVIAALLCGVSSLWGWAVESGSLMGFGQDDRPIQPLAAIGYMALATALLAAMRSRYRTAKLLLSIPAVVIAFTLFRALLAAMLQGQALVPNRPYIVTVATLLLLTIATAASGRTGRWSSRLVIALASIALGMSVLSIFAVYGGAIRIDPSLSTVLASIPASLQASFLTVALLLWRGGTGWSELVGLNSPRARVMRRVLPLVILVPAMTELLEVTITLSGIGPAILLDVLSAAINTAIVAALVFWSLARITAEHDALSEITHAMDAAPIVLTTPGGEIQHWSRGCEELYGWTAADVLGRQKYDLLQTTDAKTGEPALRPSGRNHTDGEFVERRNDGNTLQVLEQVRRVEVPGRAPVCVHVMTDISVLVATKAALLDSEANLNMALEAHKIGTFDWERASGKLNWSLGAEQRLGLGSSEIRSFTAWAARVDPTDLLRVNETIIAAASTSAEHYTFKYRYSSPDGGIRVIEGSARCFYDASGELVRTIGVNVDVTDRNHREQALRAQEEQFRCVLATVPSAMIILDEDGIIKAFSASAERMFGYRAAETVGFHVKMLTPAAIRDKPDTFIPRYLAAIDKQIMGRPRLFSAERRDGTSVPIELWLGEAEEGETHFYTAFCRDLSERYAAEERLADMREELLHVSRLSAMGEMAIGLAHELNQPLASAVYFLGAADLLLADPANLQRGQGLVRMASEQTLRAGEIIRRMRDFVTTNDVDTQRVDVADIIDDAVALTFAGGARFDIRLHYDIDPATPAVLASRVQIQQVLVNLLRNATEELRKIPQDRRCITIATKAQGKDLVAFSVTDSGPGIAPDMLDRLYVPFVSSKGEVGMGVGLSISRRIVAAHGGSFSGENNPAGGAVFRFTLPRIDL